MKSCCNIYAPLWQNGTLPKYTFNAKELDEETGMYYYEARYYKPPVFTSRDPMFEKYFWMTPYAYCANNPVKYVDPTGKIIDPSELSDKQKKNFEKSILKARKKSPLFDKLYGTLSESPTVYKIRIGNTQDEVPAQYNKSDNSITFKNEQALTSPNAYIEEMFHAYQKSENNKLYQKGLSFNYEFEAKMVKLFILLELEQPHLPGTSQNMPILDKIEKYTDFGKKMPSSSLLDNPFIQNLYIKEANKYSELNRKTDYGNSNYKVSTHQKPVSLLRLFRDAGY